MNDFILKKTTASRNSLNHYLFNLKKAALLTGLFFFTLPAFCWAQENVEKIFLSADRMQMDINSGKSIYTGNVKITQGGLVLTGDKVTLKRSQEEIERITIIGKPAHYKQATETGQSITAQSEHMVYIASENKLILTVNAHLQQPDIKLSSHKIVYNTQDQTVIAGGNDGATSTDAQKKQAQRVNITLTPKSN